MFYKDINSTSIFNYKPSISSIHMAHIPRHKKEAKAIALEQKIKKLSDKINKNELISKQRYRALQDFVRLLTNFASHDIKNAVHNMDGLLSTVSQHNITDDYINTLKQCVDNIRNSLEEFKLLSSDKDKDSFTLIELIAALESLHRPLFKSNNIRFKVSYIEVDKNTTIKQVFHNILQVLNNLIINSYEFISPDSTNKEIALQIELNDSNIFFTVSDTGIGIPESNIKELFKPYFTTKTNGSGVGLVHVKHTLNEINGKIEYIGSNKNYNTIFSLHFPLQ